MNLFSESQIESLLRFAPQPRPPQGLKETLLAAVRASRTASSPAASVLAGVGESWLRRWWPALVPAGFCLVCAAVLAVQRMEIRELQQSVQSLAASLPPVAAVNPGAGAGSQSNTTDDAATIARLKEQVAQLTAEIAQLEKLGAENLNLRNQLAAPGAGLTPEELDALQKARDRAERIACINNLKQIGLSLRIFAGDSDGQAPPDFLSMSNEVGSTKILICPSDHGREAAKDWSSFSMANCSYELLIPASTNWETEPMRVATRCPIHGTIGLCDGSVQQLNTNRTDLLYERDGKLYLRDTSVSPK
jgi:hypothetical protein